MKFQDIFNKEGMYIADDFAEGTALEVSRDNTLYLVTYKSHMDLQPTKITMPVYGGMFKKEYTPVYTRQSLFIKK